MFIKFESLTCVMVVQLKKDKAVSGFKQKRQTQNAEHENLEQTEGEL